MTDQKRQLPVKGYKGLSNQPPLLQIQYDDGGHIGGSPCGHLMIVAWPPSKSHQVHVHNLQMCGLHGFTIVPMKPRQVPPFTLEEASITHILACPHW